nr:sulfatase-like hydrolase/transferase [Paenibacillus bovis]
MSKKKKKQRPNILFLMVDEERFPTVYDNSELKAWCKENLRTHELLRDNGIEFMNHYIGSVACAPSRATLFTGQYPSLHGVTQTTGIAKGGYDPDVFWLDPNTVPTLGDYFRAAGYRTFWKGKWHISEADILQPGSHNGLTSYDQHTGIPNQEKEQYYVNANRLDDYGFDGWIGPEPHGSDPRNSGSSAAHGVSGRDVIYSKQVVELIDSLEEDENDSPWLIVSSFVNPHDITLYGLLSRIDPRFEFNVSENMPAIPAAPTANESLLTKPVAQQSYKEVYQQAFQPTKDSEFLRQLYFSLQKQVDDEMYKIVDTLKQSKFYDNTIIIFTSDHGDLLGAHGGLFQKWYNTYEETTHVPFIIHSPELFSGRNTFEPLTSHVDVIPTLLGLANIDEEEVKKILSKDHTEVRPFVGRNLASVIKNESDCSSIHEPVYFMTDDDVTRGLNQVSLIGKPYESVEQPNHIEAVIAKLKTPGNEVEEIWKFSRYFDNPQFWSNPGVEDVQVRTKDGVPITDDTEASISVTKIKTTPVEEEFELYNITRDPLEEINLAHPTNATVETKVIQKILEQMLNQQREQKRLNPNV